MKIKFIGPGGTRHLLISQPKGYGTGGFIIKGEKNIYIDPGPGALVKSIKYGEKLKSIDEIIVTHFHLDHYGDLLGIIEAVTETERKTVLRADSLTIKHIDQYHKNFVDIVNLSETKYTFKINHGIEGYSIKIEDIYYTSDGSYSEVNVKAGVLIANLVREKPEKPLIHMSLEDLDRYIEAVDPDIVILNHFSKLILNKIHKIADKLREKYNKRFIVAKENMEIEI
jgi:ribonuclease BN (tRNA processing enzyme)